MYYSHKWSATKITWNQVLKHIHHPACESQLFPGGPRVATFMGSELLRF